MTVEQTITISWKPAAGGGAERLVVVYSPDPALVGRALVLTNLPVPIGRVETAPYGLVLDDPKISRRHAILELTGERRAWILRDLESRNGTYVDGERIDEAEVSDGRIIRVGSHVLLFQTLDAEAALHLFEKAPSQSPIIGSSHRIQRVHAAIRTAAAENFPTLILGESGVGKELVARVIHDQSQREGPFLAVNCAALPENLIESELFGHARGAFTGAAARHGLFRNAEKGTIFLDEIGEMRLDLQSKLLRVLATGEVRPVGEDRAHRVDVRVIAATNADLEKEVAENHFRGDLYARLMGYVIHVPPLRERRDDVIKLARHFLARTASGVDISPDAAEAILVYDWPYNVRELEQVMRVVAPIAQAKGTVELQDLPDRLQKPFESRRGVISLHESTHSLPLLAIRRDAPPTARELREVLTQCDGNIARVAAFFQKDRRQIYRWAERLGIDVSSYRRGDEEG